MVLGLPVVNQCSNVMQIVFDSSFQKIKNPKLKWILGRILREKIIERMPFSELYYEMHKDIPTSPSN